MIMAHPRSLDDIRRAVGTVCSAIRDEAAHEPWERVDERDLWREVVAGILGSRASYEAAVQAVEALEMEGLLDGRAWLSRLSSYEREVEATLSGRSPTRQRKNQSLRYPYPRQRATRIRHGVAEVYGKGESMKSLLGSAPCPGAARRELADRIPGIGPKQASMFLRNIGYPGEFAVLDVHVLKYMRWNALLPDAEPRVQTLREYESVESLFLAHVHGLGLCPTKFDMAVWVVMRVAKRECSEWHW